MADSKMMIQLRSELKTDENLTALFMQQCAAAGLMHAESSPLALVQTGMGDEDFRLELRKLDEPKLGAVFVDFVGGAMAHRRKFGGGRGEAVAKAVGVKGAELPTVIDATAGLGRDAFVLASVGCRVRLVERHPVVRLLLQDGLRRAYRDAEIGDMMRRNMQLLEVCHIAELDPARDFADVVYLDPMYPHKQKSALVKKEMRVFQHLVGADSDADALLAPACRLARKRVVVKRPDYAEYLAQIPPHFSRETKNHRFDIYLP
ncbi:class I SAM-dependent methyltransferase [Bisgaard Taxon 10/6]|uniref:Ribosomal RNA small subunit methyltransferase J n=2 Tax=Exercitatus varius TaxID=67857 RepID=A0ABT6EVZ8_9PAST|nr:class I SAM-dependent methyltransferase [Exercitatus varius]MDG2939833.1 class I SAM-dependent methyltransferase [Exercitatus varius]MDG2946517.1 class I SAM-dependent methyltransferase [Exercitatus varius]